MDVFDLFLGKSLRVSLSDLLSGSLDLVSVILRITAASTATLRPTDLTTSKTLTIELETAAFGTSTLVSGFLSRAYNLR